MVTDGQLGSGVPGAFASTHAGVPMTAPTSYPHLVDWKQHAGIPIAAFG